MVEDWAQIHAAEGDLTLILLSVPPGCWDYKLHNVSGVLGAGESTGLCLLDKCLSYILIPLILVFHLLKLFFVYGCMTVYCLCLVPVEAEEVIRFLRIRVIDSCELQCGCW